MHNHNRPDAAPGPDASAGPAYAIALRLISYFEEQQPLMGELVANCESLASVARALVNGIADGVDRLPDDSPWQELYARLLQLSHLNNVIRERYAYADSSPATAAPKAAEGMMQQFLDLTLLAMELEDLVAAITAPN